MTKIPGSALILGLAVVLAGGALGACSDDAADKLGTRGGPGGSSGGAAADGGDPNNPNGGGPPPEEALFRAIEPEVQKKCGGACHTDATYKPEPPAFLAPPDAYKSIKSHPGIVTRDVYQSSFLTKGPHAGPAVSTDPEFEKKVVEWLEAESLAIRSQKLPTTDPVAIVAGPNDVDLTKVCVGGLTGVHLKFTAAVIGGMLELSNMKLVAPAGTDVHILKPRFVKVLAAEVNGQTEIADPADSFSNLDQTVPGGQETTLGPGSVLFSGEGWRPYDFGKDKIRIEAEKLEPGKVQVLEQPKVCKDVAGFTANVLPSLRGGNGFTPNCANCHGNGLAGLSLNNGDQALVCNQVLSKLNEQNIAQSVMVTKVTNGPHNGGLVNNAANWTAVFNNNRAVFF